MTYMLVRSIVQRKGDWVATVAPDTPVSQAVGELSRHGVGALVVSSDGSTIAGILSERDVVRGVANHGTAALDLAVAELMTEEVLTCRLDETVDSLMAIMTSNRCRHLPVVDGDVLVGIVSIGDVVNHRVEELQVEARTLHDYIETGR
jgi:CBS domain-containing protein